jgi:hypothetical protein
MATLQHGRHGVAPGLQLLVAVGALGVGSAGFEPGQDVVVGVVGGQVEPEVEPGGAQQPQQGREGGCRWSRS